VTKISLTIFALGFLFLTGCASGTYRARQEQREKMASSAGLYCEWINGDKHADIDVELNMQMAKRCDSSKPFTLAPYKNNADQNGIMYCCAMTGGGSPVMSSSTHEKSSSSSTSGPAAKSSSSAGPEVTKSSGKGKGSGGENDEIVEDK